MLLKNGAVGRARISKAFSREVLFVPRTRSAAF
jgi:hypothetical protein